MVSASGQSLIDLIRIDFFNWQYSLGIIINTLFAMFIGSDAKFHFGFRANDQIHNGLSGDLYLGRLTIDTGPHGRRAIENEHNIRRLSSLCLKHCGRAATVAKTVTNTTDRLNHIFKDFP